MEQNTALIDIEEINSAFQDDNFEIEVYEVEEKEDGDELNILYFTDEQIESRESYPEIFREDESSIEKIDERDSDKRLVKD